MGFSTVPVRKYSNRVNIISLNSWQLLIVGILLISVGCTVCKEKLSFNLVSVILLIYTSAISTVSFTLWFILIKYHKAYVVEQ